MSKAPSCTPVERRVLEFIEEYGPGLDFGGAGAIGADRKAVQRFLLSGHVAGADHRQVQGLTETGRALLARLRRRDKAKKRVAFRRDARNFEGGRR
jgi:hypothetical protein